jgi:peptidoglycan/xylan/chitin deacetylase (PgdA/CDA1 family)
VGRRNEAVMHAVRAAGFEVGIHCYDHIRWQDHLHEMTLDEVRAEFIRARTEFRRVFGQEAHTAGAAGWQSSAFSRTVYDETGLLYGSDTRGMTPFFPRVHQHVFSTLEIPTTLPTLDELLGRPEFPDARIAPHLFSLLKPDGLNVFTLHAEIEGMARRAIFRHFLDLCRRGKVEFVRLEDVARNCLANRESIPVCDLAQGTVDGRSGFVAVQQA